MNEDRARFRQDPQQEQEWLRQLNLIYSGLIGIGVVVVAQASAFTGVVAGFWHILWIAGVGMLAFGVVGVGCTRRAGGAWSRTGWSCPRTARNPATPSHSPFDGERPGAAGPGPRWSCRP